MRLLALTLELLFLTTAAQASSNDAWANFTLDVTQACATSSGLDQPEVSDLVMFDDTLNKVAMLVTGTYPQPHLNKANGTILCIYDKATQKTWIDEALGWSAPIRQLGE